MFIIALTGGLGAGKSTASDYFRSRGATVISLDDVARHALAPGSETLRRVAMSFGDEILTPEGALDPARLADKAFASKQTVAALNSIVHPEVAREVGTSLTQLRLLPDQPDVVVIEVPLLAEAPVFAEIADDVVAVEAPESIRIDRAVSRGMARDEACRRIACQATDADRASLADVTIANEGSLEGFIGSLAAYWDSRVAGKDSVAP